MTWGLAYSLCTRSFTYLEIISFGPCQLLLVCLAKLRKFCQNPKTCDCFKIAQACFSFSYKIWSQPIGPVFIRMVVEWERVTCWFTCHACGDNSWRLTFESIWAFFNIGKENFLFFDHRQGAGLGQVCICCCAPPPYYPPTMSLVSFVFSNIGQKVFRKLLKLTFSLKFWPRSLLNRWILCMRWALRSIFGG